MRNFCNGGLASNELLLLARPTCLLLVLSLLTSIIAAPNLGEISANIPSTTVNVIEFHKCPPLGCFMRCSAGLEIDEAGCPMCKCKKDPCRDFICPEDETCELISVNCFRAPCDPIATCKKIKSTTF